VTVEVEGDLVTLRGIVERAYEKSSAEATVRQVPGVIGVRNEITVRAVQEVDQATFLSLAVDPQQVIAG
jgi:hypothetical protein